MKVYSTEVEQFMIVHYGELSEKDQRRYLSIESKKIGYGGISYIANLFGVTRHRIYHGIKELDHPDLFAEIPEGKQRRKGAGAPKKKTMKRS